ncbi:DUF4760 domain-containing protein [Actinoplanes sp. CA-030573]|uniref:DUF4760 domain-containing protein n=1 Tax=Actinoplanes sp. CA-030573 TaxID=3239898 RepID=UPI003D93F95D
MLRIAPIVISSIALGFSVFAFREGRIRYKRDLFLKIHELMISEDQYRGRQLLLMGTFRDDNSIESLPADQRANISRALGAYDTLGLYLRRGYLIEEDVMTMWGDPARRAWNAAEPFVARRKERSGLPAYPYFEYLSDQAVRWHRKHHASG